jgi:hypothetical protein
LLKMYLFENNVCLTKGAVATRTMSFGGKRKNPRFYQEFKILKLLPGVAVPKGLFQADQFQAYESTNRPLTHFFSKRHFFIRNPTNNPLSAAAEA